MEIQMEKMRLLLIEEDQISREVLGLMLSKDFELTVLDDLSKAQQEVTNNHYDIVILDMQCSAYQPLSLCKDVASLTLSQPPIVIAMGEDTNEQTIRDIFQAGAYDYFIKPYSVAVFHESMVRLSATITDYQNLQENDQTARDTLGIAMAQSSYYGFAFDLLSDINHSRNIESLAHSVLNGLASRGVHCAIQIIDFQEEVHNYETNSDVVGERTKQVLTVVRDQGRIFRFGKRLVFNDEHVSLFVKSMEDTSDVAYDCVLDIGAKLIPCIEEQLYAISEHTLLTELQQDTKDIVEELHLGLKHQADQTQKIIHNVVSNIHTSFDELELTEAQERFFIQLIESELEVDHSAVDFEQIESAAQKIYDKIFELQNKQTTEPTQSTQFGDIDLF